MNTSDSDAERLAEIRRKLTNRSVSLPYVEIAQFLLRLIAARDAEIERLQEKLTDSYGWGMKDGMSYSRPQPEAEREAAERERERYAGIVAAYAHNNRADNQTWAADELDDAESDIRDISAPETKP